jgi:predicted acyl esterase
VRLQNPDLVAEIRDNPFYTAELGDDLAPRLFVDRIEVPTFVAGAWQDEQTGGRFPTMLDRFTGTDHLYASLTNGLHTDSISPAVFPRFVEFLDLYVAERTPSLGAASFVAPVLAAGLFGTDQVPGGTFDDRFAGLSHAEALAAFEAEPPIQVLFENGAADGVAPLTPGARFVAGFDAWPIDATPTTWYLDGSGGLVDAPAADDGSVTYAADPSAVPATFWDGNSSDLWRTDVAWNWVEPPAGTAASFLSAQLAETLTMVGSGSVDLWLDSDATDTDVEVTLTEVRPDGTEVLVQSGWLRASHRALDEAASTALRPIATHVETDAAPLNPPGDFDLLRVELFPFAHVFRAGSQLRLTVDAPGGNRPVWVI